ncbi:MAG: hypothetical protein V4792_21145 [Pseudomonadota bacterium]
MRGHVLCLLLALMPCAAVAEDNSPLGMSYVATPDLKLVYFDSLAHLAPHVVRTFTNSHAWQRRMFGWVPSHFTGMLLKDFSDYGNGAAWTAPRNTIFLDIAPTSLAFETSSTAERIYSLMNHELVHVATMDVASEEDRRWRRWLRGKVSPQSQNPESLLYTYLTVPRFTVPRWYLEGSAVFMETWMAGGIGRAQGGYDEMVFRAMVRDDAPFYDPLGLVSRGTLVDFQVGANAYLYGTRFFTYLAYAYSPEKVVAWLRRDEGSRRHYADQFQHVFGTTLEQGWKDWIEFERDFQRRNLAKVREQPITTQRKLNGAAVGSISRTHYDEATGILYGAFRTPGVVEHVGALNTRDGSYRNIVDIKRAMLYRVASFAVDPDTGTAFYTNDNLAERDLMALDLKTGQARMLLEDARIGELAFNPVDRSLMGVRHMNGLASLVRIPYPYREWQVVHEYPYGVVPSDLDISPDGRLLSASVAEVNADQYVRVWPLDKVLVGNLTPLSEFRFGQSVPESFVFSRDGRYLYGSSYYTGVSNIFRYEVANGAVEAVSNAEVGYFRPSALPDGRLLVLAYTGEGFVPVTIDPKPIADVSAIAFLGSALVAKHPVIKTWQVPPPNTVDEEKLVTGRGAYAPPRHLGLVNAYPVLQGYKDVAGIGYRFNFEDPIRFAHLSFTAAWTPGAGELPGDQRLHLMVDGRYLGWRGGLSWNKSDFYDLFGPTKRSRKGYELRLGYDHHLIYDDPRKLELSGDFKHAGNIDTLPSAQNIATTFTKLTTGEVKLSYTDLRRSLGAVDDEKGLAWTTALTVNRAGRRESALLRAGLDFGFALPLAHSSIWSRSAAGIASGKRDDEVATFYFGGFGNNYIDHGTVKRYREYGSMPGFEIDALSARRFFKQTLEWTLPPYVFESVGTPSLHATWLRPAVFATALWTAADDGSAKRKVGSVGTQIDVRISTLHWYEMMLSVGYARGFERWRRSSDEWMVSLKLL